MTYCAFFTSFCRLLCLNGMIVFLLNKFKNFKKCLLTFQIQDADFKMVSLANLQTNVDEYM